MSTMKMQVSHAHTQENVLPVRSMNTNKMAYPTPGQQLNFSYSCGLSILAWHKWADHGYSHEYISHAQTFDNLFSGRDCCGIYTLHMRKPAITFVLKVLHRMDVRPLHMPNIVLTFLLDCLGTYFTHAQTCDNVQSTIDWIAWVHILCTCRNLG